MRARDADEAAFEELLEAAEGVLGEVDKLGDEIPLSLKSAWGMLSAALRAYGRGPEPWGPAEPQEQREQPCEAYRTWNGETAPCARCRRPAWEHQGELITIAWGDGEGQHLVQEWTGLMAEAHQCWKRGGRVEVVNDTPQTWRLRMEYGPRNEEDR